MRAINSTAVSLSTSSGILNGEEKKNYDEFAQGHSSNMARQLYTRTTENDRANGIQKITDSINEQYTNTDNVSDSETESDNEDSYQPFCATVQSISDENTAGRREVDSHVLSPKKRMQKEVVTWDDWGLKHADFGVFNRKIKWSEYEKNYISTFIGAHSHVYDKWDKCLQSIWQADAVVRHQFHVKHIVQSTGLRGAIRVR